MADNSNLLTFILSDESLNSYGTRILTAGIDLSLFKKNPIMLWNHFRTWSGKTDEVLPIGRWENIRKENGQLLADAVFDDKDEFAQKIKSKVEQKIINMASVGINVIVTSEDASVLVQGQTRPTVIKSLLKEASVCDIASNRNALRLYDDDGGEINLSDSTSNHLLPLIEQPKNKNNMNLCEQIALTLNLKEGQSEELILNKVRALVKEHGDMTLKIGNYEKEDQARATQRVTSLIDTAIKDRKITASDRPQYLSLAEANFDAAKAILDKMQSVVDLSELPQNDTEDNKPYEAGKVWEKKFRETGQLD